MRHALLGIAVATLPMTMPAAAQAVPDPVVVNTDVDTTDGASLGHSAIKATTFKMGSTVANVALLSYATGGIVGGVALSAFMLGSSWLVYTANDYMWDRYEPPPARQAAGESFDFGANAWRNTLKFITFKPVVASLKVASIYVYTGSIGVATMFGAASIVSNGAIFYANNMAWDMYDWYSQPVPVAQPVVVEPHMVEPRM